MLKILLIMLSCLIMVSPASAGPQPLPAGQAFVFSTSIKNNNRLILQWKISPGYYLYRDKLSVTLSPESQVKIEPFILPEGQAKKDLNGATHSVYFDGLNIFISLQAPVNGNLDLNIQYQGCSNQGFCYAPITKSLSVNLSALESQGDLTSLIHSADDSVTHQDYATQLLMGHHLIFVMLGFLALGLLLAFTPCVLPMIPILSGIIVGYGNTISTKKAFSLSLAYVGGMALSYAMAGMIVALLGSHIQSALQKPPVIVIFSAVFFLLALSLFDFYDLKLPTHWHHHLVTRSNRQKSGSYVGVFLMGVLSTLIVSPCVSAPLVGVLTYIARSGDILLGGAALLSLGIGMGIPLLLVGVSAGSLLPKSGAWMHGVKKIVGLLMLGVAIWLLERILSGSTILLLWAVLFIFSAILIWKDKAIHTSWYKLSKGVGIIFACYGFILVGGAIIGNSDPFHPLQGLAVNHPAKSPFLVVANEAQLAQQLAIAKAAKKPVLLDFYADWCVSCVAMDRHVFSDLAVQQALTNFVLLRADVTQNNADDQALMKHFKVIAPPTVAIFDIHSNELPERSMVGDVDAKQFLTDIKNYCDAKASDC